MSTSLDVLDGFAQSELRTADLRSLRTLNQPQFEDFAQALYELYVCEVDFSPEIGDDNITGALSIGPTDMLFFKGLTPLDRRALCDAVLMRPLQLLLYYPVVWIEDPLQWYVTNVQSFSDYRALLPIFSDVVEFFIRTRPLLTSGALRISPLNYPYHSVFNQRINYLDNLGYKDEAVMSVLDRRTGGIMRDRPLVDLNRGIVSIEYLRAALVVRGRDGAAIWRHYATVLSQAISKLGGEVETIASPLVNLPIPRFSTLSASDIISIRRDELAFAEWRGQVRLALDRLRVGAATRRELERELSDQLREGSLRLHNEIMKSSLRTRVRKAAIGFSIGSTSAFVTSGDALNSLVSGTAGALVTALFGMFTRRPSTARLALAKHYSVFGTSEH